MLAADGTKVVEFLPIGSTLGSTGRASGRLDEVVAALNRLDDGASGTHEETGEPIDPARLEALPAARTNFR